MPSPESKKSLFLRASRSEPVERVPVWIMRQAGRYLPDYQAVRARHSFLEICKTPELAAEVSLQPLRVLDVDAAIVFSDILIVAEAMGLPLDVPDSGPILSNPVRDLAAIRRLSDFDPGGETKFVGDAIRLICREAGPDVPVIGFAAAPWTLACYMIEGQTHGDVSRAKRMLRENPEAVRELLTRIAQATVGYLRSQLDAGASAVQLFDTWAMELSAEEFREFELPAIQTILEGLSRYDAPKILFAKSSARHLENLAASGADVISVDAATDLAEARLALDCTVDGARSCKIALQGNVAPEILLRSEDEIRDAVACAIQKTGGLGHILNLAHGILPNTPVRNAQVFVEAARAASASGNVREESPVESKVEK